MTHRELVQAVIVAWADQHGIGLGDQPDTLADAIVAELARARMLRYPPRPPVDQLAFDLEVP